MRQVTATCWCEATEVLIPVEWISEGRTLPCTRPGCLPGCEAQHDQDDQDTDCGSTTGRPTRRIKMNRWTPGKYAPIDDSSVDYRVGSLREQYPSALILAITPGDCPCGCAITPKGKNATFGMGHDIRLRGKLIRAAAAGAKVVEVDPANDSHRQHDPIDFAAFYSTDKLDWSASVAAGVDRIANRGKHADKAVLAAATGPMVGDRELLKIGRWSYDGRVVAIYKKGAEIEFEYSDAKGVVHVVRKTADGKLAKVS